MVISTRPVTLHCGALVASLVGASAARQAVVVRSAPRTCPYGGVPLSSPLLSVLHVITLPLAEVGQASHRVERFSPIPQEPAGGMRVQVHQLFSRREGRGDSPDFSIPRGWASSSRRLRVIRGPQSRSDALPHLVQLLMNGGQLSHEGGDRYRRDQRAPTADGSLAVPTGQKVPCGRNMRPGVDGEWRGTSIATCPLSRLTNLVGAGTNHPPSWCASRSPPSCGSASFNGGPIFPRRRRTNA